MLTRSSGPARDEHPFTVNGRHLGDLYVKVNDPQPIEHCFTQPGIREYLRPFGKGQIGRHDYSCFLVMGSDQANRAGIPDQ